MNFRRLLLAEGRSSISFQRVYFLIKFPVLHIEGLAEIHGSRITLGYLPKTDRTAESSGNHLVLRNLNFFSYLHRFLWHQRTQGACAGQIEPGNFIITIFLLVAFSIVIENKIKRAIISPGIQRWDQI